MNPTSTPLTFGNITATPNVGTTQAQMDTAKGAGWTPTTTIPATAIGNTQPFTPPATQTSGSAQNSLGAIVAPQPSVSSGTSNYETQRSNAINSLLGIESSQTGKASETADLENSLGVDTATQNKQNLDTQAATTAKHYDDLIEAARNNPNGQDTAGVTATVDQITRQKNNDLANIAIQQSAATNDVARLTAIVTQKVAADTEEQTNKINALKDYINSLDTDPATKAQLTAQANATQAKLDSVKTAGNDALKTASQNGAPASVLDAIGKAIADPNATAENIYKAGGAYLQTKTPASPTLGPGGNEYMPIDVSQVKDPNAGNSAWGGLSLNGLSNAAEHYLSTGTMPSLGLGGKGAVQTQRQSVINYAGQLADALGMTQPQIQAMYKANSASATQIIERMAKIDTISSAATTQFPRLADLADKVKAAGITITESDLQSTSVQIQSKFGSTDAANLIELLQTIRGDYGGLQSAMGGSSRGGVFFSQKADSAIPAGLTGQQYLGIMQTMQTSASNVAKATQDEANSLIGVGTNNPTGAAGGEVPTAPITNSTQIQLNGKTYTYNGSGDTSDMSNWTAK